MWNDDQQTQIRARLLDEGSDDLIRFMHQKNLHADLSDTAPQAIRSAIDLGWIDEASDSLTPMGHMAADSCREYSFWLERGKALPFEGVAQHLTASYFADRTVMEIGPGMGANLLSLSAAGSQVLGVEPVEAYAVMGRIFAEREGLPSMDIRIGQAEALPFEDNELDTVLCVTAHQYFDIHRALSEIARVLRPGGELIIVGATFWSFCTNNVGFLFDNMGQAKAYILTVLNTSSYTISGQRIIPARNGAQSTTRPIYPGPKAMHRWMRAAGLRECSPDTSVGVETCFHYARA